MFNCYFICIIESDYMDEKFLYMNQIFVLKEESKESF